MDVDHGRAMKQTIEGGGGHNGIAGEHLAPFGERLVAGEDDRLLALIALADNLEQQGGLGTIERQIADLSVFIRDRCGEAVWCDRSRRGCCVPWQAVPFGESGRRSHWR